MQSEKEQTRAEEHVVVAEMRFTNNYIMKFCNDMEISSLATFPLTAEPVLVLLTIKTSLINNTWSYTWRSKHWEKNISHTLGNLSTSSAKLEPSYSAKNLNAFSGELVKSQTPHFVRNVIACLLENSSGSSI